MLDDKALPPTSDEYLAMETAKAFHYTWSDWCAESPIVQAKLMAHELHKGMRDAYQYEETSGKEGSPKAGLADQIRNRFFR